MYLPETIDLGQSEKYVLSIRLASNGFMFSISEPGIGGSYCFRETTFRDSDDLKSNVQRIVFELSFLTQEFKQTNVIIASNKYDLIPELYYDKKQKEILYNTTHVDKSYCVLTSHIASQEIYNLFDIEDSVYEFLSRSLWNPQFYHHSGLLIDMFEKKTKASETKLKMFLNFHDSFMDVLCFSGSKLLYCQTYENEAPTNQLYYILKIWEKTGFDQLKDYIYLIGKSDDLIINRLQEYIKNVEQMNAIPSEVFLWNEDARKAPLDLLSLAL